MKKLMLFFVCILIAGIQTLSAQTKSITGAVTSKEDGASIPGVSVMVKGTTVGTVTDMDGKFILGVPADAKTLVFSFIGMKNLEVEIGNQTTINVTMETDVFSVDEVVVVGYGTKQKREVAGAISTVKGEDIKLMPVQSFEQSLQGKAAGVMITMPNGVLNNPPVIRVRGFNSITSSSYPLIVVDGVPIFTGDVSSTSAAANTLGDINPADILTMDVLKDASATAIYGSRAANGVILITTKRGAQGKVKVSYDGFVGWTEPYRVYDMMNADQYVEHKNRALSYNPTALSSQFFIPTDANNQPINTNWADEVYQTGFQQSHSFSISGATPTTNYYLSLGYLDQEGMIKKNAFTRKSIRFNIDQKVTKYLKAGANMNYTNSFNSAPNTGSLEGQAFNTAGAGRLAFVLPPNLAPYKNDGTYNIAGSAIGNMGQPVANYGYYNPVAIMDLCYYTAENDHVLANLYATLEPFKGFVIKTAYGIDNLSVESISFQTGITGDGYSSNGSATNTFNRPNRWTWTNTANYDFTIAENLNLGLLAGVEEQSTEGNS